VTKHRKPGVSILEHLLSRGIRIGDCLEWHGANNGNGYGVFTLNSQKLYVHRYVWEQSNRLLGPNEDVLHHCDNTKCFELRHLFLGDAIINGLDMASKGRSRAPKGEHSHLTRIPFSDVERIRVMYDTGEYSTRQLGEIFKVDAGYVSRLVNYQQRVNE
jgi:hypothetical protein